MTARKFLSKEQKLARIAEIDAMFESAQTWGSWMVGASNERAGLVRLLKKYDDTIVEHKYTTEAD